MKKWIAALVALVLVALSGCGVGEETLEAWAHEAGWMPFPLAVQREELDDTWEEAAKAFGDMTGMEMDGPMLKDMMLIGYAYEPQMDFMEIEGNRIIMKSREGEVMFDHEYNWVETVEDVLDTPVHVFKTEDADAGSYTYLCMTVPVEKTTTAGNYLSFNLFNSEDHYRATFDTHVGSGVQLPCSMIQADIRTDVLQAEVMTVFAGPAVMIN